MAGNEKDQLGFFFSFFFFFFFSVKDANQPSFHPPPLGRSNVKLVDQIKLRPNVSDGLCKIGKSSNNE